MIYSESTEFPATYIVRGGTFDDPGVVEPGVHIWVKHKHPWIKLPSGVQQFDEEYNFREVWPTNTLERLDAATNAPSSTGLTPTAGKQSGDWSQEQR